MNYITILTCRVWSLQLENYPLLTYLTHFFIASAYACIRCNAYEYKRTIPVRVYSLRKQNNFIYFTSMESCPEQDVTIESRKSSILVVLSRCLHNFAWYYIVQQCGRGTQLCFMSEITKCIVCKREKQLCLLPANMLRC